MRCTRCGFQPKNPEGVLAESTILSGVPNGLVCVSRQQCRKRIARKPQYDAASWASPSFEQQMST